jgi:serine/threonine protein kinase
VPAETKDATAFTLEAAKTHRILPKDPPRPSTRSLLIGDDTKYELGAVIGEGGMGVVRTAIQPSLQRVVAVKTLRPNATEADALAVLREAWVTGFLEHPNIIPIHEITTAEDGSPLVVMRRIQGVSWHDALHDPSHATAAGARDLLEHNLRVLVQVCHALVFAHEKGVVHRDVKPANVMLGSFGEVYLLDWGISCALFGDALLHLPGAKESIEPAGTIPYLAPEMAGILTCELSEQSDIYLLGAVLFEIATKAPPHPIEIVGALKSIAVSPPEIPSYVEAGLAAICRRAMQYEPAKRYASVAEFRDAIQSFLVHRDSLYVASAGQTLLSQLRTAIASDAPRRVLYDIWGECRFAFRESLRTWPDNPEARGGLSLAATALAEHELDRDPRVASAILDEVAEPPSTLRARVHAAIERDDRERERNAKLASELDPAVASPLRTAVLVAAGTAWTVSALVGERIGPWTNVRFLVGSALPIPVLLYLRFGTRLAGTLFNRRVLATLLLLCSAHAGLFATCAGLSIDVGAARTLQVAIGFVIATMAAITIDTRLWPMTLGLAGAVLVSVIAPDIRPWVTAVAYFGMTVNFAIVWRKPMR